MKLYNHVAYKMCQHEMDMAQHIPEGGNWKNIPEEITDKHFSTIDEFVDDIENYGFERTGKVETHNNFVYLKFTKI